MPGTMFDVPSDLPMDLRPIPGPSIDIRPQKCLRAVRSSIPETSGEMRKMMDF